MQREHGAEARAHTNIKRVNTNNELIQAEYDIEQTEKIVQILFIV